MESTLKKLSLTKRQALAHFYEMEGYTAFKELLELERHNLATKLADVIPTDVVTIAKHQGRIDAYKQLHLVLKANYEADKKS